ncbi:Odorant receptor Or2a, partial [Rhyzopertha dominica]
MNLKDSLWLHIKLLRVFGYWKPREKTIWSRYYNFYALLMLGVLYFYVFQEVMSLAVSTHDVEKSFDVLFWLLPHCPELVKAYFFYIKSDRLKDLVESLDRPNFQPRNQRQRQIACTMIKSSQRMYIAYLCAATFTLTVFTIKAGTNVAGRTLPLGAYIPFNTDKSPNYELAAAYQYILYLTTAYLNITFDMFSAGMMANICVQIDFLHDTASNIANGIVSEMQVSISKSSLAELNKRLVKCVDHHRTILRFSDELQDLLSSSILAQMGLSITILSMTSYSLVQVSDTVDFIAIVSFQVNMLLQILPYCYYGNEIIEKSDKLSESFYMSRWEDCPVDYRKKILFIMLKLRNPIRHTAGGVFAMSLSTFLA